MTLIRFYNTIILFFSFSILVAQDPPANNSYETATILTVQPGSCSSQTQGDLTHATNTNNSDSSSGCIPGNYGAIAYADVWYKATVPSSGKLTIETSAVSGSPLDDTVMVAYTLNEGVLTEISCNDDKNSIDNLYFSKIILTHQQVNVNDEIYIMVVEYNNIRGNLNSIGPFNICVFDPDGTLDLPQTQKPLLSYYSNPVGDRLSVESPYQIQTLRVFDLMGKEVLRKTPNQQKLSLNTYPLAPGAYLLRVETPEGQQTVKLIKK